MADFGGQFTQAERDRARATKGGVVSVLKSWREVPLKQYPWKGNYQEWEFFKVPVPILNAIFSFYATSNPWYQDQDPKKQFDFSLTGSFLDSQGNLVVQAKKIQSNPLDYRMLIFEDGHSRFEKTAGLAAIFPGIVERGNNWGPDVNGFEVGLFSVVTLEELDRIRQCKVRVIPLASPPPSGPVKPGNQETPGAEEGGGPGTPFYFGGMCCGISFFGVAFVIVLGFILKKRA
jgi:hypothetical protein